MDEENLGHLEVMPDSSKTGEGLAGIAHGRAQI